MDTGDLAAACIECCSNAGEYMEARRFENPDMGMSVAEATFELDGDGAVFRLQARIQETFGLMLRIDDRLYSDAEVCFQEFNEVTRTVKATPSDWIMDKLRGKKDKRVQLVSDMRWLLRMTGRYFESFGSHLGLPSPAHRHEEFSDIFPPMLEPTTQQRGAVESVLSNPLTYVWGAPGTGKTQFVLATCLISLLRAG